ncbi:MAG: hypothetical protein ACOVT5_01530, partial [Armatimonadaceae bacterium]
VLRGTLDRVDDQDGGFDIEMALPWTALGLAPGSGPASGTPVTGCAVVYKSGSNPTVFPADAQPDRPAGWPVIRTEPGAGLTMIRRETPPVIDGRIEGAEWPGTGLVVAVPDLIPERNAPVLPLPLDPLVPGDRSVPIPDRNDDTLLAERHVFARFWPGLNADLLKRSAPPRGVLDPNGIFTPIDHPAIAYGPWTSSDRVGWHRLQLTGMAQAGIDTAWTMVVPDGHPMSPFDTKALTVLGAARRELEREGESVPALALWIEPTADSTPIDLSTESGKSSLYRTIQRWMDTVPVSQRRVVRVPMGEGTVPAYPIALAVPAAWSNADAAWASELRARFAAEYGAKSGGATLWFVGNSDFPAGATFDSRMGSDDARLLVRVVRPGSQAPFVSRRFGETFKGAWEAAKEAHWVVVDSWNDYNAATDIAPSRQYGEGYIGLNRLFRNSVVSSRFASAPLQIGDADLPRRARPGQLFPIDFPIRNQGARPLAASEVKLEYRWLRDGAVVTEGANSGQPTGPLAPGVPTTVRLAVTTVGAGAQPVAPGVYTLEVSAKHPGGTARKARTIEISETDSVDIVSTTLPP